MNRNSTLTQQVVLAVEIKPTTDRENMELTEAQPKIAGQFNYCAFENPAKRFEEVMLRSV